MSIKLDESMNRPIQNDIFFKFSTFQHELPPSSFESIYQMITYALVDVKRQLIITCEHANIDDNPNIFNDMNVEVNDQTLSIQTSKIVRLIIEYPVIPHLLSLLRGTIADDKIRGIEMSLHVGDEPKLGFSEEIQRLSIQQVTDVKWNDKQFHQLKTINKGTFFPTRVGTKILEDDVNDPQFLALHDELSKFKKNTIASGVEIPSGGMWDASDPLALITRLRGVQVIGKWMFFPTNSKSNLFMIFRPSDLQSFISILTEGSNH